MTVESQSVNSLQLGYMLLWYKIEAILGRGGFGITYLAHDINLDKRVAIKEYLPLDMASRKSDKTVYANDSSVKDFEKGLNRFIREARTMAKFEHPNIVRILNVFEENNTAYMAMAYEKGKDLKELITPGKTLGEDEMLRIISPILDGLELVHSAGFIHRDIKPGNIMIRKDGTPVLIDFGSSHDTRKTTAQVTTLVSPGFTPHEQYTGEPNSQGSWTDIYSLGATLYRCISGTNPVDALTRGVAIIQKLADPLVAATEIGKSKYSIHVLRAIDHAMEFDDKHRPRDIASWRRELAGDKHVVATQISKQILPNSERKLDDTQKIDTAPIPPDGKRSEIPLLAISVALIIGIAISFFLVNKDPEPQIKTVQTETSSAEKQIIKLDTTVINTPVSNEDQTSDKIKNESTITDKLKDGSSAPDLIILSTGSFLIGSKNTELGRHENEGSQKQVHLLHLVALGKTEVTVSQFKKFVEDTNHITDAENDAKKGCRIFENEWVWKSNHYWRKPGYFQTDEHPVVCISWNDAVAYTEWLSEQTGHFYTLPSESEWEYAARSDTSTLRFWEQNNESACLYANVSDITRATMHNLNKSDKNIFACEDGYAYSSPVGSFKENPYGFYDILGNVWEWTADCWNNSYDNLPLDGQPHLSGNCENRVYRGGAWGNSPNLIRAAKRGTDPKEFRYYNVGFRVRRLIE